MVKALIENGNYQIGIINQLHENLQQEQSFRINFKKKGIQEIGSLFSFLEIFFSITSPERSLVQLQELGCALQHR